MEGVNYYRKNITLFKQVRKNYHSDFDRTWYEYKKTWTLQAYYADVVNFNPPFCKTLSISLNSSSRLIFIYKRIDYVGIWLLFTWPKVRVTWKNNDLVKGHGTHRRLRRLTIPYKMYYDDKMINYQRIYLNFSLLIKQMLFYISCKICKHNLISIDFMASVYELFDNPS